MATNPKIPEADPFSSTERLIQTFRMPRELVIFLKSEAAARGLDLTAHVNRHLDGVRTWFNLPVAATFLLEADRKALDLGRYEYLQHLLFRRSQELGDKEPGFDAPSPKEPRRR
jgi:hypothetical protein